MIMNYTLFLESSLFKTELIAFHKSNNSNHLKNLKLIYSSDEDNVFGKAIYFSSSADTSYQMGKYIGKYKIKLDNPLNLNQNITPEYANILLKKFVKQYNLEIYYYNRDLGESVDYYDFTDEYENLQYGNFFLELTDICGFDSNKHFFDFIKNILKFDSFYHFSDFGTNFIEEKGDYGFCYGIYNENDIQFIEWF